MRGINKNVLFLLCKEGTEETPNNFPQAVSGMWKISRIFPVTGVREPPDCKWSTAKTAGKTVFPGVFPRFGEGDFFFGGLGGVQSPSRAPRLGSSGDFFGSFLVSQKGTYHNLAAARASRSDALRRGAGYVPAPAAAPAGSCRRWRWRCRWCPGWGPAR